MSRTNDDGKTGMDPGGFGSDIGSVSVHSDSTQVPHIQAEAFAQAENLHLATGQEQHLPHEAWHVVQQRAGRVDQGLPFTDPGTPKLHE